MSRKAKHRKPSPFLEYPLAWTIAQHRNRKALRETDARIRKANRKAKREAFWFDLKEWFMQDD
jgi:hypothetical protein